MFRRADFIELNEYLLDRYKLQPTGSYKRGNEFINDLDFLTYNNLQEIYNDMKLMGWNMTMISNGTKFLHFRLWDIIDVNIWKINKDNHIFQKLAHDYDTTFQISARRIAKNKNMKLTNEGLYDENGIKIPIKKMKDIFDILSINYRSPQIGHLSKKSNV
jgi:DNA polymerase/3'-5' exonuclease PolX